MKKLATGILCGLVALSGFAQKANVDQAKKLIGKVDKIGEARSLIQEAMKNPETANDPNTYYIAGKIEWEALAKNRLTQAITPDKVDPVEMGNELLNGFDYFLKVLPLDQIPNEKGQVKPKFTKEIQKKIAEADNDFFNAGAVFYSANKFYPEAYNSFMIYGDMAEMDELGPNKPAIPDTMRATSYLNAGLAAWQANEVDAAAKAFGKARMNNYPHPEATIYEIACWQNIEGNDTTRGEEAKQHIFAAASDGYKKFGIEPPVFLNNMVNSMINSNQDNEALAMVNDAISKYGDKASLYGLRGFINDRMNNDDASEADYRKAAAMDDADYDTMRNALTKLLRVGQQKWNDIELGDPEAHAKKQNIRTNYFEAAKAMAEKAKSLTNDPSDMDYLLESIDYQLSL